MEEEMFTYQYYKRRSIMKPNPTATYLLSGILTIVALYACAVAATFIR